MSNSRQALRVQFPPAFQPLFRPARYKVFYGGRGSAKSWAYARALLLRAYREPIRVLCAREIQASIAESVHHLLAEQIGEIGLAPWFTVRDSYIVSHTGAEFIFKGLRHNVTEIKSMEGIDVVWVEEAEKVSDPSWQTLIPTIRKPGSEIWVSFNPADEADPTYKRFVLKPPPEAVVVKVSWRDNPWFPDELRREKDYLQRVDPDAYAHVWEGECKISSAAQVLNGKWVVEAFDPVVAKPGEKLPDGVKPWDGPYYGADWGFAQDPTTLVRCWINGRTLHVEHEAYAVGVDIDATPEMFDRVPGAREHTVRADSARPETISYMQRHGYPRMTAVPKWSGSVEDGIAHLRQYERIVIHPRCKYAAQEARLYSYKVDRLTGDILADVVDANNHIWDAVRYALNPLIQNAKMGMLAFIDEERDAEARKRKEQEQQQ